MKWIKLLDENCFGNLSETAKNSFRNSLIRNYCEVLDVYSYTPNSHDRKLIKERFISDGILRLHYEYIPKEYAKYGLVIGRYIFLGKHYFIRIMEKLSGKG